MVQGSAAASEQMSSLITRMALVVCLVLGAALVIALSGLANTTDVSVLERIREIGVLRATGSTMTPATERAINTAVRGQELMVSGSASGVERMSSQIMRVALIVCLVLGAALVIALSGLANTTDVSVLERVREIGVLRATGSSRQEIHRLIVTEGVLVAAVGGGLGLLVGTALGVSETLAMAKSAEGMTVHIPSLALIGIFTATLAVGLAASVRPAGRAASVPPVRALSEE